jgi:hypothetical protein
VPSVVVIAGCNKEIAKPPHEGDRTSGPSGGGGGAVTIPTTGPTIADAGLVDGACTNLDVVGATVEGTGVNGDFTGSGGPIADGTYDLVQVSVYLGASGLGGPTGVTYQGAVRINGNVYESAIITSGTGAAGETTTLGTLTPSGVDSTASLVLSCPSGGLQSLLYSAQDTGLTLYNTSTKIAFVLRQRP